MRARPVEGEAKGASRAWSGPGLVAILLLAAALAWHDARRSLLADLEETAEAHRRAVLAVLDPGEALEAPAGGRDEGDRRERALAVTAALVAALDGGPIRVALVAGDPVPTGDSGGAVVRELAPLGLALVHRLEEGVLLRAGLAAAAPWVASAGLLALGLVITGRRERRAAAQRAARERARAAAEEALRAHLAEAEAQEALLLAAVEAIGEGVAIVEPDGRPIVLNTAFRRGLAGRGIAIPAEPGAALDLAALARIEELRRLELARGQLLLLPEVAATAQRTAPPLPAGPAGPRLAGIVQELGEALARVAREAVVLNELATDPAARARLERLRAAAERCTRLLAPLLAPPRPPLRRAVALDALIAERLARLFADRATRPAVAIAPGLPPASADPERLAALLDGLLQALAASNALAAAPGSARPDALRVQLRRGEGGLVLELEGPASGEDGESLDPLVWGERAREAGAALRLERTASLLRIRLELPIHATGQGGRLVLIEGEGGGRSAGAATGRAGPRSA